MSSYDLQKLTIVGLFFRATYSGSVFLKLMAFGYRATFIMFKQEFKQEKTLLTLIGSKS